MVYQNENKMTEPFKKFFLSSATDYFAELQSSCVFEPICRGREACIVVRPSFDNSIPIVRTTTAYQLAAQPYSATHSKMQKDIVEACNMGKLEFNNIMVELYSSLYRTMGEHSDQALDLQKDSFIALFSCYNTKNPQSLRKLVVKNKATLETFAITLEQNSVVIFSTETNAKYLHKIVLERPREEEQWIGLTFRNSNTWVNFSDGVAYIDDNIKLTMANSEQLIDFRRMRAQENKSLDFIYPKIDFTTSPSDLLQIKGSV